MKKESIRNNREANADVIATNIKEKREVKIQVLSLKLYKKRIEKVNAKVIVGKSKNKNICNKMLHLLTEYSILSPITSPPFFSLAFLNFLIYGSAAPF